MKKTKAINEGARMESEHKETYNSIRRYVKENCIMPSKQYFYKKIAKDHIKEIGPNYYKSLKEMEKKLKSKRGKK